MTFELEPECPPPKTPRPEVPFDVAATFCLAVLRSPKSVALPVEPIAM